MSRQRATFGKLQRERDKQAKAKAKRERRLAAGDAGGEPGEAGDRPSGPASEASPEVVMELVADLHRRFERSEIGLDDYEEEKAALLSRLVIE